MPIKSRVDLAPGIDVRADGGYIVLAPSQLEGGKAYRWDDEVTEAADLPEWLLTLLISKPATEPKNGGETEGLSYVPEGYRHDFLVRTVGSLRRHITNEQELFRTLSAINQEKCNPPIEETEVRSICQSTTHWSSSSSLSFPCTDSGNAEMFSWRFQDYLQYDHGRKRWMVWREHWWQEDVDGEVFRKAKEVVRYRQAQAKSMEGDAGKVVAAWGKKSESKTSIDSLIRLSTTERQLSYAGTWDDNHYLLGVANGVVDLRNGELRDGKQSDRITMHMKVPHEPGTTCPRWEQFISEIMEGDVECITYLQRAIGYSLLGTTKEHVMFLCYGEGANGKSVLLKTLCKLFGEHAWVTGFSTFDAKNNSSIPNDLAALAGRRLIWASEVPQDAKLQEAKVKQFVHGDEISARFLNREFFTYTPIGKLWLTVNHMPEVADDSAGFWRSVHCLPFAAQFMGEKADPHLLEKLLEELPGVLNWAIAGCSSYLNNGLRPPKKVTDAVEAYKTENDVLSGFISSCCETGPGMSDGADNLFKAYTRWCKEMGFGLRDILSNKTFGMKLGKQFQKTRAASGNVYLGIKAQPQGGTYGSYDY